MPAEAGIHRGLIAMNRERYRGDLPLSGVGAYVIA